MCDAILGRRPHLDLIRAPCALYGVKYIDLVSLAPFLAGASLGRAGEAEGLRVGRNNGQFFVYHALPRCRRVPSVCPYLLSPICPYLLPSVCPYLLPSVFPYLLSSVCLFVRLFLLVFRSVLYFRFTQYNSLLRFPSLPERRKASSVLESD